MKQKLPLAALCALATVSSADLLSKTSVSAGARLTVDGTVAAGTTIMALNDGLFWNQINACQNVTLGDRTMYAGVHASTFTKGANLSGPALDPVTSCTAPTYTNGPFAPGSIAASVTNQGRLDLAAAARGDVSVQNQSTLILEPGVHQFNSLNVGPNCQIVFKLGASLKVKGNLTASNALRLTGDGVSTAALEVGGNLSVGTDGFFPMPVVVTGSANLGDRADLYSLQAASIVLGNDCHVSGKRGGITEPATALFTDNFNSESYGFGTLANPKLLTNWNITSGTVDVAGYSDGFLLLDPAQGRMVDMTGSDVSGVPGNISTKTIFPVGTYQIQFKLAGSLRKEVPYTYEVQVTFGNFSQVIGLPWDTQDTLYTYNVPLTQPSALSFKGITTMTSYPANAANLWLDDVAVYRSAN